MGRRRGDAALLFFGLTSALFLFLAVFLPAPSGLKSLPDAAATAVVPGRLAIGPILNAAIAPDAYLVQRNSLRGLSAPQTIKPQVLADLAGQDAVFPGASRQEVIEYFAREGDTVFGLAESFGISVETIVWANNLKISNNLAIGQKLIILPVSGVIHIVKAGETLAEIAKGYKAGLAETIDFNGLADANEVFPGDIVVVPGGVMPALPKLPAPVFAPLAAGYFNCPITAPCRLTQGLHWYNAVDFSHGSCGEPVLAAASGAVQKVRLTGSPSKWAFGGAGNHLTILHPNGVVTFYGHLQQALVSPGQEVSRGQTIGLIGGALGMPGSGKSTGCHLHFQVIGAKNPFVR